MPLIASSSVLVQQKRWGNVCFYSLNLSIFSISGRKTPNFQYHKIEGKKLCYPSLLCLAFCVVLLCLLIVDLCLLFFLLCVSVKRKFSVIFFSSPCSFIALVVISSLFLSFFPLGQSLFKLLFPFLGGL
jgi:hypothetical protein